MSNCSGNMMSTSEFDETGKVCSIWTKCDCIYFLLNFVVSFASGADHQASSAIVSKQTFCVKNLYTITFCSYATNFACFIKFWSAHHVPWTISHLFLGYRGISIIQGKIVAFSNVSSKYVTIPIHHIIWRNGDKIPHHWVFFFSYLS